MYNGQQTYYGAAACDHTYNLGDVLYFSVDGRVAVCSDCGLLSAYGVAVDLWMPDITTGNAEVSTAYGDYTSIEVIDNIDVGRYGRCREL